MLRIATQLFIALIAVLMGGCASLNQPESLNTIVGKCQTTPPESQKAGAFEFSHSDAGELTEPRSQPSYFSNYPKSDMAIRFQSDDSTDAQIFFDPDVLSSSKSNEMPERIWPQRSRSSLGSLWTDIKTDHRNLYSIKNLPVAASLLGAGAWMANSDLDQNILEHIQDNITFNSKTNEYQEFVGEFRFFGEGYFLLPVYAGTAILGKYVFDDSPKAALAGEWGERSMRAFAIGAPVLVLSQFATGGSRPGESPDVREGSEWQFFEDNNGVSGHAFMGAIPFLTAYHMTDNRKLKVVYFAASTLPALSRITENGHYPSQALLGWGLAYLATSSIGCTENESFEVVPFLSETGVGIGVTMRR